MDRKVHEALEWAGKRVQKVVEDACSVVMGNASRGMQSDVGEALCFAVRLIVSVERECVIECDDVVYVGWW